MMTQVNVSQESKDIIRRLIITVRHFKVKSFQNKNSLTKSDK